MDFLISAAIYLEQLLDINFLLGAVADVGIGQRVESESGNSVVRPQHGRLVGQRARCSHIDSIRRFFFEVGEAQRSPAVLVSRYLHHLVLAQMVVLEVSSRLDLAARRSDAPLCGVQRAHCHRADLA